MKEGKKKSHSVFEDGKPKETIKIKHTKSPDFFRTTTTNCFVSGPTPDGMFHIVFFSDAIDVSAETGHLQTVSTEGGKEAITYKTKIQKEDLETFREDKLMVSIPHKALRELRDILNNMLPPSPTNPVGNVNISSHGQL